MENVGRPGRNKDLYNMNKEEHKKPFMQLDGFKDALFNLGDNTRKMTFLELMDMHEIIRGHLVTCCRLFHDLKYYHNFEDRISRMLDEQEEQYKDHFADDGQPLFYSVGGNFGGFMEISTISGYSNNNEAARVLEEKYKQLNPDNTLEFDAEMSYCYVYTRDRKEAEEFLVYSYREIIRPFLAPWLENWETVAKLIENSPEHKARINSMIYL